MSGRPVHDTIILDEPFWELLVNHKGAKYPQTEHYKNKPFIHLKQDRLRQLEILSKTQVFEFEELDEDEYYANLEIFNLVITGFSLDVSSIKRTAFNDYFGCCGRVLEREYGHPTRLKSHAGFRNDREIISTCPPIMGHNSFVTVDKELIDYLKLVTICEIVQKTHSKRYKTPEITNNKISSFIEQQRPVGDYPIIEAIRKHINETLLLKKKFFLK